MTHNIFLSCPMHFDRGLIVFIEYNFQIWNKKEHIIIIRSGISSCGGLSTFRSLRDLLSGFVSTNTTKVLRACKQMECNNNKYQETNHLIIITNMILFTQPLRSGRIWHKVNFLSRVERVWIQSFPSPRLVTSPRLKNLVCPTIYP